MKRERTEAVSMLQTFVSLKAYGDLVILRQALKSAEVGSRVAIGSHLVDLFDSLGPFRGERFVLQNGSQVPALFDVKRRGIGAAARSAGQLRRELTRLVAPSGATLVFDRLGWRERFIAGARDATSLPPAPNVYLAYERFARRSPAPRAHGAAAAVPAAATSLGIFPASRVAAKNLPLRLIEDVIRVCRRARVRPSLHLLEDERPDLASLEIRTERVPRSFTSLAAAVRSVDRVVSADSLPAHLAEFFGVPVFVLTPRANDYWLPLSAYEAQRWSRFDEEIGDPDGLAAFLAANTADLAR